MVRRDFAGCDIEELVSYDAHIEEGTGHRGISALLGAVIRR